ncbi:MAG: LysR family transcriptional regulator [Oceanospirillaceae bacterium]|nr:LysR family transcriptional regulator [Oceanospirillaceae bacterium]
MSDPIDWRKLPPLKSLKGFEASARLLSVRKAAQELNLTHPAISHQIQTIESALGVKLFSRAGRNIALTEAGTRYYVFVKKALDLLIAGFDEIVPKKESPNLRLQTYVSLSIRWLAPRLHHFQKAYPHIDIQLSSFNPGWEFDEDNADIGLIYTQTPVAKHLHWIKIFSADIFAVCSPELLKDAKQSFGVQQLTQLPLLTVASEAKYWNWQQWFAAAGVMNIDNCEVITVDTAAAAIEMAINGEGVALVSESIVSADLKAGRLVKAVDHSLQADGEWGVVCSKNMLDSPGMREVLDWLVAQQA